MISLIFQTKLIMSLKRVPVLEYENMWGNKWFMLANPVYGHWEQSIYGFEVLDEESRTKAKLENIRVN